MNEHRRRLAVVLATLALAACTSSPTPSPTSPAPATASPPAATASPNPPATAVPSASPTLGVAPTDLALVADVREPRLGLTSAQVLAALPTMLVPCGVADVALGGRTLALPATACVPADAITGRIHGHAGLLALLPPGLVGPRVKVLQVDGSDLFGGPSIRAKPYPLTAVATGLPAAWTAYDVTQIRTVDSTGDTCPDRGPANEAIVLHKGWPWTLDGGYARYTGTYMDTRYSGPTGDGWPVVLAKRTGQTGSVRQLISDSDITANDFECPMLAGFTYHAKGTVFNVDPRVGPLLASAGVNVVTLGSNHITDAGTTGVRQTLQILDANHIAHTGAGLDLASALAPAVIDVRGVTFAFVGWDDIAGSGAAAPGRPGVAPLTDANVKASLALARSKADVVFAMPQWGWPEYHNGFTKQELSQRAEFFADGADDVLGSGTHWASAVSITPDASGADHFVIGSHGNFLFGQDWSRQTMEGVVVELTFSGTTLVQARLHPYVVLDEAQPNLIDPATDGRYVLNQVWSVSQLP
ncbi:MAG TPA: CapA family protein [Candidatus Sulfotelmatobacter sp.]|nr:CapA family protein [Candidatus Sulfotelmatobacter sp.]